MSSSPAALRLVVPGFASQWPLAALPRLPALEKLVSRGTVTQFHRTLPGWQSWRLDTLALLGLQPDRWHASAPLEWLGQGGQPRQGSWLLAEFVHLEMGSHSARLHRIQAFDAASGNALLKAFAAHLHDSGFAALASPRSPNYFFLHSARTLKAICPEPDFSAGAEVQELMPQGESGAVLRRLLTEAQMLLHEHPVNAQRERSGLQGVNAIWLSGLGDFEALQPLPLPGIWSDEPYLHGLCRLHCHASQPLADAAEIVANGRQGVVIVPVREMPDLQALEERWLMPLAAALSAGQLPDLELFLERWQVRIDRAGLRRFWRRSGSLSGLLQ